MQQNEEKEFYKLLQTAWSCSIYFLWFCGDQTIKSRGQNKYKPIVAWNAEWWHSDIDSRVSMD